MLRIFTLLLTLAASHAQGLIINPFFSATNPANTLSDVLVYWKHDEADAVSPRVDSADSQNLTDVGGSNVAGVITNATRMASGAYLTHVDSATLSTGNIDWTFTCWVRLVNKVQDKYIIGKWNTGAANTKEYLFYYHLGPDRFKWAVSDCSSFAEVTASTLGSPTLNIYYFVVMWHDSVNNVIGIQVNNGTADTAAWTTGGCDTATGFALGALVSSGAGSGASATLDIDETGLWKRLLTTAEKTYLYNAGAGHTCCPFP